MKIAVEVGFVVGTTAPTTPIYYAAVSKSYAKLLFIIIAFKIERAVFSYPYRIILEDNKIFLFFNIFHHTF